MVLTLCGVLKDIILVVASMIIWGTEVTPLQSFGYSIALIGMIYYKLGYEQIKGHIGNASRQWATFGAEKPVLQRITMIVGSLFFLACIVQSMHSGRSSSLMTEIRA